MRVIAAFALLLTAACASAEAPPPAPPAAAVSGDPLADAPAAHWRALDPEQTLYLDLPQGRAIIALAPDFAPNHVANIKALARENYFDDGAILRSQDNYVVQWGRPEEDERTPQTAREALAAEFDRTISADLPFAALPDPDTYAPHVGFTGDFPAARDPALNLTWLTHCYGMVGAGRAQEPDSGGGTQLYVVIGQSPRHLDRNVTLVGRVVRGMELLSVLPRGTGPLGFYETAEERTPLVRARVAADVPEAERVNLEVLRTDTATFAAYVESRRFRREDWFVQPTGHIGICNIQPPVRERTP